MLKSILRGRILVLLTITLAITTIIYTYIQPNSTRASISLSNCHQFPDASNLKFSNDYWQIQDTSVGRFQLLNAYLDDRGSRKSIENSSTITIIGMFNRINPDERFFCKLWYNEFEEPSIVGASFYWIWKQAWIQSKNFDQPYLIFCKLPNDRIPSSVSLVEKECDVATNNLKIANEKIYEKKDFVVCVKGLNFPFDDQTVRMAEWIELVRILGADKIHFYQFHVHPNVTKLLNYYLEQGKIDVTPITLVGDVSNSAEYQTKYLKEKTGERRLQEVLPFNDCFYRYMHKYKFVVLLDIDEVIVPADGDWFTLMEILQREQPNKASYLGRNVYFFDNGESDESGDIPKYMHMLKHVKRSKQYCKLGDFVKGFHDTSKVVALYNHISLLCFDTECENSGIDVKYAHLQHYRKSCVKEIPNCEEMKRNTVVDRRLWNYKKKLIDGVNATLKNLKLLT